MKIAPLHSWYIGHRKNDTLQDMYGEMDAISLDEGATFENVIEQSSLSEAELTLVLNKHCNVWSLPELSITSALFLRLKSKHFHYFKKQGFAVLAKSFGDKLQFFSNQMSLCLKENDDPIVHWIPTSVYEEYWTKVDAMRRVFRSNSQRKEYWRTALGLCLLDAQSKSAQEILIVPRKPFRYDFVGDGDHYRGRLSSEAIVGLQEVISSNSLKSLFPIANVTATWLGSLETGIIRVSIQENQSLASTSGLEKTKQILIIDDDTSFSSVLEKSLASADYTILRASSVEDALLKYLQEDNKVDLIVCDLHMAGMDGEQLVGIVRSQGDSVPILILTGDESYGLSDRLKSFGADAVVVKTESPSVLMSEIQGLID